MGTVRYVTSSDGLKVRNEAAGNEVKDTLVFGDIMYDIGTGTIPRVYAGTVYNWRYVYYYRDHDTQSEGYGWVADEFTQEVSATVPSESDVISKDAKLPLYLSLINARYIYQYLRNKGWHVNAIYAMLGNMETESYINPGKWENGEENPGYGLTQWTPPSKYIDDWLIKIEHKSEADKGKIECVNKSL